MGYCCKKYKNTVKTFPESSSVYNFNYYFYIQKNVDWHNYLQPLNYSSVQIYKS